MVCPDPKGMVLIHFLLREDRHFRSKNLYWKFPFVLNIYLNVQTLTFPQKFAIWFSKKEGRSKAAWNFSENSYVLVLEWVIIRKAGRQITFSNQYHCASSGSKTICEHFMITDQCWCAGYRCWFNGDQSCLHKKEPWKKPAVGHRNSAVGA